MIASYSSIKSGIAKFLDEEVLSQIKSDNPLKTFGVNVFATLAISKSEEMIAGLKKYPLIDALNIVTDEGVEIDLLKEAAEKAFPTAGIEIEIPLIEKKIKVYKIDIDTLYKNIMEAQR